MLQRGVKQEGEGWSDVFSIVLRKLPWYVVGTECLVEG